jgi:hypothetical protein|tara:strand:- start:2548 stop:2721 length:174 start_codon:yes stop_codon:yes gene_type:complete
MAYVLARKDKELAFWSSSGVQAGDLVHLLSAVATGKRQGPRGDMMDGLLGQLEDEAE